MQKMTAQSVFELYYDSDTQSFEDHYIGEFGNSVQSMLEEYTELLLQISDEAKELVELWDIDYLYDEILDRTCWKSGHLFRNYSTDNLVIPVKKENQDQLALF